MLAIVTHSRAYLSVLRGERAQVGHDARGYENVADQAVVGDAQLGGHLTPPGLLASQTVDQLGGTHQFLTAQVDLFAV